MPQMGANQSAPAAIPRGYTTGASAGRRKCLTPCERAAEDRARCEDDAGNQHQPHQPAVSACWDAENPGATRRRTSCGAKMAAIAASPATISTAQLSDR